MAVSTDSDAAPAPAAGCLGPQRRRGAALEDAIVDAAFAELTEVGYAAFAVENVAARARTGKASIYRRWGSKQELVMAALAAHLHGPDDESMRAAGWHDDELTTADALRGVGRLIVETLRSPAGRAMRAIKLEATSDPELAALVDQQFQAPRRAAMLALLRRGVARGEVRPEAATTVVADVLPAVLTHRLLMQGEQVSATEIETIIEQVMIPLVSVR